MSKLCNISCKIILRYLIAKSSFINLRNPILILLHFCFFTSQIVYSSIDLNSNAQLNRKLFELEQLYYSNKYDEAIKQARVLMAEASNNSTIKQKAYDILLLSLEKQSSEKSKILKEEEKVKKQAIFTENFEKGAKYLAENNYQQAITYFKNAINAYGGDSESWYYLGLAYKKNKNFDEAYKAFLESIKLNQNHIKAIYNASELAFRKQIYSEAEKFSKKIIDLLEKQILELQSVYDQTLSKNFQEKALEFTQKIKSYQLYLFQAYLIYGIVSKVNKNYESAKSAFIKASKLSNSNPEVFFHLADAYFFLKSYYQASINYEQAIALYDIKLRDTRIKAKKLLQENKPDDAVELEVTAQKIQKRILYSYYYLALCYWHRQELSSALETINKALEINKDFTKARLLKVIIQIAKKDYTKALAEARTILASSQANSEEAKQAIKIIKFIMGKLSPITTETFPTSQLFEQISLKSSKKFEYPSQKYLKELNGIDGRSTEKKLQPIIEKFQEINQLIVRKNIPEATRILQELEKNYNDISEIPKALGWCYVQMSRFEEGIEAYKRALDINPSDAETMVNLAYLYALKAKNIDEALNLANNAIKLLPNRHDFYFCRGFIYFKQGELNKALKDFELVTKYNSQHVLSIYNSGIIHYLMNNYDSAENRFLRVISIKPNFIKAKIFLALTQAKLQKNHQAIKNLEEALSNIPQQHVTYKILSDLLERMKFAITTNSSVYLPNIKTTVPIKEMLLKAMQYRAKGFLNKAKDIYLEIQRLAPNCFEAYYELGDLYASRGLNAQAIKAWHQASKIKPNDYKLIVSMAKVKYKIGYKEEAKSDFNRAIGIEPNNPEPLYYLGLLAYEDKNYQLAEIYALKAVSTNKPYLKAWALLGLSRLKLGKYKLARDAYETLYVKAPSSSSLKRHAQKKLWEIAQILQPHQFASFEHAKQVGKEITQKVTQSQQLPISRLSFDPSQAAKLLAFTQPTAKERILISKKIAELKAKASKYKAPPLPMTSKYQLPPQITIKRKPDPADPQIKEANDLALKGFINKAIDVLQNAKQISPNNFELLINLAFFHLLIGNYKEAFDEISNCVTIYPENSLARLFIGNMYWLGGMPEEAIEQWNYVSLPINIKNNNLLFFNLSENSWKNIKETTFNDPDPSANLAIIYLFIGKFAESIAESTMVLNLDPEQIDHIYYQAMASTIMYVKSKLKTHKKRALELITSLELTDPTFPHLQSIKSYVSKL